MLAQNIVLADAAGTPVSHTFVPSGIDSKTGIYWYTDRSQANAIGYWRISIEFKEPPVAVNSGMNSSERNYRVRVGLHEPVLETISNSTVSGITPAPTVAYVPRSFTEFILSERTALLERKHLRKMTANLMNDVQVIDVVENLARIQG
jgi:hypothetical protein